MRANDYVARAKDPACIELELCHRVDVHHPKHDSGSIRTACRPHVEPARVSRVEQERGGAVLLLAESGHRAEPFLISVHLRVGLPVRQEACEISEEVPVPRLDASRAGHQAATARGRGARGGPLGA
eukprot:scaffold87853_cov32-Tisochrysis_lutea.AAC.2